MPRCLWITEYRSPDDCITLCAASDQPSVLSVVHANTPAANIPTITSNRCLFDVRGNLAVSIETEDSAMFSSMPSVGSSEVTHLRNAACRSRHRNTISEKRRGAARDGRKRKCRAFTRCARCRCTDIRSRRRWAEDPRSRQRNHDQKLPERSRGNRLVGGNCELGADLAPTRILQEIPS